MEGVEAVEPVQEQVLVELRNRILRQTLASCSLRELAASIVLDDISNHRLGLQQVGALQDVSHFLHQLQRLALPRELVPCPDCVEGILRVFGTVSFTSSLLQAKGEVLKFAILSNDFLLQVGVLDPGEVALVVLPQSVPGMFLHALQVFPVLQLALLNVQFFFCFLLFILLLLLIIFDPAHLLNETLFAVHVSFTSPLLQTFHVSADFRVVHAC